MNLALIVTSGKDQFGGHHVSIKDLTNNFSSNNINVDVINLKEDSVVLSPIGSHKVEVNLLNPNSILKFRYYLKSGNYSAIFCFDELSTRYLLITIPDLLHKIVPVKPGYLNSSSWTNACKFFINFSEENHLYYKSLPKYKKVVLKYIPNRVKPLKNKINDRSLGFIDSLNLKKNNKIILVPTRIDPNKKELIEKGINFYKFLNDKEYYLVIAGLVNCELTYNWLQNITKEINNCKILTSNKITNNISEIFYSVDIIIAMGRTAMEAMSLNKFVCVPVKGKELPILITEKNFNILKYYNFTNRSVISKEDYKLNIELIKSFKHNLKFDNYQVTGILFSQFLDVNNAFEKYLKIINDLDPSSKFLVSSSAWIKSLIRVFFIELKSILKWS